MEVNDYHQLDNQLNKCILKYDDIDITYIVRNHIVATLRTDLNIGNSEIKISTDVLKRFINNAFRTFPSVFKMREVWVLSNAERRKKIGENYYDRVASMVSESIPNTIYIENPVRQDHKFPTKDLILSDAVFFCFSFIFSLLFFRKSKLILDNQIFNIAKSNGIQIDPTPRIKRFVGQYRFMQFYLKYIYSPKMVFVVYPNGYNGYIYAFKKVNIPVVELQHGVIYPLHPDYNTILNTKSKIFKPDYLLVYGEQDKNTVANINYVDVDRAFVVGSYGLWKTKEEIVVGDYLFSKLNNYKTLIIIATIIDIDELYEFALKIGKIYKSLNILLLPRLKVTQYSDTENVKILDVEKTNVFETFKVADYLLTKISTSALESLFMDIPTFIIKDYNRPSTFEKNYPNITSLNYVVDEKELIEKIKKNDFLIPSEKDKNQVFATNVVENFNESLIKIKNHFYQ